MSDKPHPEGSRTPQGAEQPKKQYRVKEGMVWGSGESRLQAGEIVELTEVEAAGFLDLLEPVEAGLEAETGKDFTVTGTEPPTLSETDAPAPRVPRKPS